ncbi:TIGR03618 family F420-dependent PPOX class oxidoreductase [Micromonospora purpureochromogenes]|uniref:TIGR03618 family F420-dependent PPOX class oxidoreductase n=1 Tax=Micromonospora purpureochromogenes TaxID=47872 RepID=UPI0033DCFC75
MLAAPGADLLDRLDRERTVWLCTLRPDGSPHLTPVWFRYAEGRFWIGSADWTVKTRNVQADPRVSLALPDTDAPVVAEGVVTVVRPPFPPDVVAALAERYDGWDIATAGPDGQYVLFRVDVTRWLMAGRTLTG